MLEDDFMEDGRKHFDQYYSDEFLKSMKMVPKSARQQFLAHFREVFAAGWTACALSKLKVFLADMEDNNGTV